MWNFDEQYGCQHVFIATVSSFQISNNFVQKTETNMSDVLIFIYPAGRLHQKPLALSPSLVKIGSS
jgi:hypothetical protein